MKLAVVLGTRPQLIKWSPMRRALARRDIETFVLDTGQHYDRRLWSDLLEELSIPAPEFNCAVGSATHGAQTGRMLEAIEGVLLEQRPDRVLVFGDTNSTLAGALAAAKLRIPVSHVEAGLRSADRYMPEEINRVLVDRLSDQLFAPTEIAGSRLAEEGIDERSIHVVGDVMLDAVREHCPDAEEARQRVEALCGGALQRPLLFVTVHRAENTEAAPLRRIAHAVAALAADFEVLWPLHPRTEAALAAGEELNALRERIHLLGPCSYLDSLALVRRAQTVITDSGGLQKEAFFLERPTVTLREATEWRELVESGWNRLVPADEGLEGRLREALQRTGDLEHDAGLFGDGRASQRIADHIAAGDVRT
ncbi:MAG: UDP-N-acetylglucosamine 2-epimerase (non-hydrolyzing) [Acidobacteriota bacterium]